MNRARSRIDVDDRFLAAGHEIGQVILARIAPPMIVDLQIRAICPVEHAGFDGQDRGDVARRRAVGREEISYRCFCSRERASEAVACIDPADLEEMIRDGEDVEIGCQFCDATYLFTPEDLKKLRREEKTE